MEIAENVVLQAILDAMTSVMAEDDPEAKTTRELQRVIGRDRKYIVEALRVLIEAGEWECVKVPRTGIDGSARTVPAYRPKAA